MKESCLTVTLNPAVDEIMSILGFQPGQEYRVAKSTISAGGKGVNVARALRRWGVPVVATGFCGGATAEFFRRGLCEDGIADEFVTIDGQTRTCLTVVDLHSRRVTRIIPDGPTVSQKEIRLFIKKFERLLVRITWVVLSGRLIDGAGKDFYAELIHRAKHQGKNVLLDTSGEPLRRGLQSSPDFVKPNRQEAEWLLGEEIKSARAVQRAIKKLSTDKAKGVILSLGRNGAAACDGKSIWLVKPPVLPTTHAVGCGDSLVAGFVAAIMKQHPFPDAVRWGVAAGAANVLAKRPGDISAQQVRKILPRVNMNVSRTCS